MREREPSGPGAALGPSIDAILPVVLHDLRNSLSTVLLNSTALLDATERPEISDELREQLGWIAGAAERMSQSLATLHDLSALHGGRVRWHLAPLSLATFLASALGRIRQRLPEIQLNIRAVVAEHTLEADPDRLPDAFAAVVLWITERTGPREAWIAVDGATAEILVDVGSGEAPLHAPNGPWRPLEPGDLGRSGPDLVAGLELASAAAIIAAHGGRLLLCPGGASGPVIRIHLPTVQP